MGLFLFYLFFMCIFLKLLVLIHLKIDNNSVGKHMIGIRNCVHLASIPCSLSDCELLTKQRRNKNGSHSDSQSQQSQIS